MYDPAVVDMFERVCRDIAPLGGQAAAAEGDQTDQQDGGDVAAPSRSPPRRRPVSEGPESLRALANLARVVSGRPTAADIASMIWSHVRHVVPNASCAFFVSEPATDSVKVRIRGRQRRVDAAGARDEAGREADRLGRREPAADRQFGGQARSRIGGRARRPQLLPRLARSSSTAQLAGVLSLYGADAFRTSRRRRCSS